MRFLRSTVALLATVLVVYACTERAGLNEIVRPSAIKLVPRFSSVSNSNLAPITRARLTAKHPITGAVLVSVIFDINPNDNQWTLGLDVPPDAGSVVVVIELIDSSNEVVWSGVTDPIEVRPGQSNPPVPVTLTPGPSDNLSVIAVSIAPHGATVTEGASVQLNANISGGGPNVKLAWSSLDTNVADVSATGLVTTKRNGDVRIAAQAGPKADTVIVSALQRAASIRVSPDTQRVSTVGVDVDYSATVLDPRNSPIAGASVAWSVENAAIASHQGNGRFRALANGTTRVIAASGTLTASGVLVVNQRATTIAISPTSISFGALGAQHTFTAAVRDAGGAIMTVPITWRTSNANVATVSSAGTVTAIAQGTAEIVAVANSGRPDSIFAVAQVQVNQSIVGIDVIPTSGLLQAIADSLRFSATAVDVNGNAVPNAQFVWASTNPAVATVDADGIARAVANGTTQITASAGGVTIRVPLTVAQRVQSVSVTPASDSVVVGQTISFSAVARDSRGYAVGSASFTWSVNDTLIARINASGVATGRQPGTVTIRATSGTVVGTATLRVVAGGTNSIAYVNGNTQSGTVGAALAQQLVVNVRNPLGNPVAGVVVRWVATAGGGSITPDSTLTDANGLARTTWTLGTTPGTNTAEARATGLSGTPIVFTATASAGALARVVIAAPDSVSLTAVGDTIRFTASGFDQYSNAVTISPVWTSLDTTVAAVDAGGKATARAQGRARIVASASALADTVIINVTQPVTSVVISPDSATLNALGDTVPLTATARDALGAPVATSIAWTSLDPSIARVTTSGQVISLAVGTARIRAGAGTVADTVTIRSRQVPFTLSLATVRDTLVVGDTLTLVATPRDSNNVAITGGTTTWTSSDTTRATVSSSGLVRAQAAGVDTVRANYSGLIATKVFVIRAGSAIMTWVGGTSSNWNLAANFSTGIQPTASDSVLVPANATVMPVMTANDTIGGLRIDTGATLSIATFSLTINGNVSGGGTVSQSSLAGQVALNGNGTVRNVTLPFTIVTNGTRQFADSVTLNGRLYGSVNGVVNIGSAKVRVTPVVFGLNTFGDFELTSSGARLIMQDSLGELNVSRSVAFSNTGNAGDLTAGTMRIGSQFTMNSSAGGSAFSPSGSHTVVFNGTGPQNVIFRNPGATATTQHFNNLVIDKTGTDSVYISGDAYITKNVTVLGGRVTTACCTSSTGIWKVFVGGNIADAVGDRWAPQKTSLYGTSVSLPSSMVTRLFFEQSTATTTTLQSNFNVKGEIIINSAHTVVVNGHHIHTVSAPNVSTGSLSVSNGNLLMTNAADTVEADAGATFGGSTVGKLTAGTLLIAGGNVTGTLAASGTHTTVLNSQSTQHLNVTGSSPTAGGHFQNLTIRTREGTANAIDSLQYYGAVTPASFQTYVNGTLDLVGRLDLSSLSELIVGGDFIWRNRSVLLNHGGSLTVGGNTIVGDSVIAPNLKITSISSLQDTLIIGDSARYVIKVTNAGRMRADPSTVRFTMVNPSGTAVSGVSSLTEISALNVGDTTTINLAFAVDTSVVWPDTVRPRAQADADGTVIEINESDNVTTGANQYVTRVMVALAIQRAAVSVDSLSVLAGDSVDVTATGLDAFNRTMAATATWSSLDPTVASVSSSGRIRAQLILSGRARIVATSGSFADTLIVNVVSATADVTRMWVGTTTSWNTASNWSPAAVPNASDVLWIRGAAAAQPVLPGNTSVAGVVIDSTAALAIGGNILTLSSKAYAYGPITATSGGKLSLVGSTGSFMGRLPELQVNGFWTGAGNATVTGDVVINGGGEFRAGGHTIHVQGGLTLDSPGYLTMINAADSISVAGNVYINRTDSNVGTLSAGVLSVAGNFATGGSASEGFRATGTHTVVLNGTSPQTVSLAYGNDGRHYFRNLEINNAAGVQFTNHVWVTEGVTITNGNATGAVNAHIGNYLTDNLGDRWQVAATRFYGGTPAIASSLKTLLFVNTSMSPTTSFAVDSVEIYGGGDLRPNGKTIRVRGNFTLDGSGYLTMINAADVVDVGGNVYINRTDSNTPSMTAGLIKVQGNFTTGGSASEAFRATGTHRVLLNGTGMQTVNLAYGNDGRHYFNLLDISNPDSVRFANHVWVGDGVTLTAGKAIGAVNAHIGNFLTDATGDRWQVAATRFYGGTPTIASSLKTLLFVNTSMSPTTSFAVDSVEIYTGGDLRPNGKTIRVRGNFTLDSSGFLTMLNSADVVDVGGNIYMNRTDGNTPTDTAGVIKVQGNFSTGPSASEAWRPAGSHRTVFNGATLQSVNLAYGNDGRHYFRNLEISNAAGVQFMNHVWVTDGVTITSGNATGAVNAHIGNYLTDNVGDRWQVAATRFYGGTPTIASSLKTLLFVNTSMSPTTSFAVDSVEVYTGGDLRPNGKTIRVRGNFTLDGSGFLTMLNSADVVDVGGNIYMNRTDGNTPTDTAGVIKVQGNFSTGPSASEAWRPAGSHRTILNGTTPQTVNLAYGNDGRHYFRNLEISNAAGVQFTNHVWVTDGVTMTSGNATGAVNAHIGNYLTDNVGDRWQVAATRFYGGTPTIASSLKTLLFVNTSMSPTTSFAVDSVEIYDGGDLRPNGKTVRVRGNFTLESSGYLTMLNGADVVDVGGNIYMNRHDGNTPTDTAGVIKVQGNFSTGPTASETWRPAGSHRTILNGTTPQTVNLAYGADGRHYFRNVDVSNAAGVMFINSLSVYDLTNTGALTIAVNVTTTVNNNLSLLAGSTTVNNGTLRYHGTLTNAGTYSGAAPVSF